MSDCKLLGVMKDELHIIIHKNTCKNVTPKSNPGSRPKRGASDKSNDNIKKNKHI